MDSSIVVALITSIFGVIGIIITNMSSNKKVETSIKTNQAVTDTKIDELTREVREHNNFARRMPVVEEKVKNLEDRVARIEKKY